jgi:hypothetical protein
MGADFIYEIVEVNQPLKYWQEILGELNDGEAQHFSDDTELYIFEEMTEQEIVERIDEAFQVVYGDSSEIGWWSPDGGITQYRLTGGMSWGDDPTDVYRDFEIVAEFQCGKPDSPRCSKKYLPDWETSPVGTPLSALE